MEEKTRKLLTSRLIIPITVGVISGVSVGVVLGVYNVILSNFIREKELSYSVSGPFEMIAFSDNKTDKSKINKVSIREIYTQKIKIWNSGSKPIKKIPVRIVFKNPDPDFMILYFSHETKPKYEFGKITLTKEGSNDYSKRFIYDLFNQSDEDTITILTNKVNELEVYAKSEGVKINPVTQETQDMKQIGDKGKYFTYSEIVLLGIIVSLIAIGINWAINRFNDVRLRNKYVFRYELTEFLEKSIKAIDLSVDSRVKELENKYKNKIEREKK